MGRRQDWARNRMTKRAIAAHGRGDTVYVHQLGNVRPAVISSWASAIESVGWKLEGQQQTTGPGMARSQLRWTLTFRRADNPPAAAGTDPGMGA